MRGLPKEGLHAPIKLASDFPSADTVAVVTLTKEAGHRHVIRKITVSYQGGTPAVAGITVTIDGSTVWQVDLPLANNKEPYDFDFPFGLYDSASDALNQEVVITAADPGTATSCAAKLNVQYE